MNKMREYERGREDGLDLARRIVREGGLEALEKECRFRGVTGIRTSLASKDLDKACIVVNIINQKWDVLVLNVIACVLCIANFIAND